MNPVDAAVYALHRMSHRRRLRFLRDCRQATSYLVTSSRQLNVDEEKIRRGRHSAWKVLLAQERSSRSRTMR